jgi:purine-nucleoside phosphorylase
MSTVHEVIVARHMGIEVLGISLVTNMAAGVLNEKINHEEVMETGKRVEKQFTELLASLVPQIAVAGIIDNGVYELKESDNKT